MWFYCPLKDNWNMGNLTESSCHKIVQRGGQHLLMDPVEIIEQIIPEGLNN